MFGGLSLAVVRDLRVARRPVTADELAAFQTDVRAGFVLARAGPLRQRGLGAAGPGQEGGGRAYQDAYADERRGLDRAAHLLGWMILTAPDLP